MQLIGKQWLLVILWMVVIFLFSHQPYSGAVTETYFGNFNVLVRKMAHLIEYALLYFFCQRAFLLSGGYFRRYSICWAFGLSFIYALTDEWHQSFVPGRSATVQDVLVDGLGMLLAIAGQFVIARFICCLKQ